MLFGNKQIVSVILLGILLGSNIITPVYGAVVDVETEVNNLRTAGDGGVFGDIITTIFDTQGKIQSNYLQLSPVWVTNGTSLYYNTGNVGIGTNTPDYKLDVQGNIRSTTGYYVGTTQVINGSAYVLGDRIAQGTIDSSEIQDNSLTHEDIADGTIRTNEITDNTITEEDISDSFVARNSDKLDNIESSSFLRSDSDDLLYEKIIVGSTNNRRAGIYGNYDSTRVGHIWSIGTGYQIPEDGSDFGNLYGLGYKHTNNTTGGNMAGGHQVVWVNNGVGTSAMGTNIWTSGAYLSDGYTVIGNDGYLEGDRIRQNSIDDSEIQDNSLTATSLAAGAVGNSELANNAVASVNVIDGAITSDDIANNTITETDISDTFVARNSDLLDGVDSTSFLRTDTLNTLTNKLRISNATYNNHLELERSGHVWNFSPSTDGSLDINHPSGGGANRIDVPGLRSNTNIYVGSDIVYTAGNSPYDTEAEIDAAIANNGYDTTPDTIADDGIIQETEIEQNSIDDSEIQDNSITASSLATNSVGNDELINDPTFSTVFSRYFRSPANSVLPKLILDSTGTGDNWSDQGAQISLGEGGDGGSASLHLTYIGDGNGYIGAGALGADGIPDASYMRFDYNSSNIYTPDTLTVGNLECSNCIDEGEMVQNSIDDSEIQDDSITASSLATNSVGNDELIDNAIFEGLTVNSTSGYKWESGINGITHNDGGGNVQIRFGHDYSSAAERFTHGSTAFYIGGDLDTNNGGLTLKVASNGGAGNDQVVSWGAPLTILKDYLSWGDAASFGGDVTLVSRGLNFGPESQRIYGDNASAIYVDSNHDTATQMIFRDKQNTVYGRVYGTSDGSSFGLLDGDANWSYRAEKDLYTSFYINNSEKMRILSNGNVGIGTTTPSEKLHINGNILANGTITANTPTANNHVATKQYVDQQILASGGAGLKVYKADGTTLLGDYLGYDNTLSGCDGILYSDVNTKRLKNLDQECRVNGTNDYIYFESTDCTAQDYIKFNTNHGKSAFYNYETGAPVTFHTGDGRTYNRRASPTYISISGVTIASKMRYGVCSSASNSDIPSDWLYTYSENLHLCGNGECQIK